MMIKQWMVMKTTMMTAMMTTAALHNVRPYAVRGQAGAVVCARGAGAD